MAAVLSKQDRDEPIAAERLSMRSGGLHICAECEHAQLFAVQPRAVCTCRGSAWSGKIVFAGQPACAAVSPRDDAEPVLSRCASGFEKTRRQSVNGPAGMR